MTECVFKKPYKFNDRRQSARECNELKTFIRQQPKKKSQRPINCRRCVLNFFHEMVMAGEITNI